MANIPGATNALPGVFTDVITQTRGVSVPGGTRIASVIGEGLTNETLVVQANGSGNDGFDSTYSTTTGSDGRHFLLGAFPLISARTKLYKNGVLLAGVEQNIDGNAFSTNYDYRVDISTGKVELQRAHLKDLGGAVYTPLSTNTGDGYLSSLTLLDANAPNEIWTIRCVSVQRNNLNNPVQDTAKFLAFGSVSGALVDANGNPIIWVANGNVVSNGILSFSIYETKSGSSSIASFVEGDAFTIEVDSGVLSANDSLTATYIPESVLNEPVFLEGFNDVIERHGTPSSENTLSLGAQLAFANSAPGLMTVQAAPAQPRRTSVILEDALVEGSDVDEDYIFPLPNGLVPDADTNIHFFVTDLTTNIENQILPNKLEFNTIGSSPTQTDFIQSTTTYDFYYSVIQEDQSLRSGEDGYLGRAGNSLINFSVPNVTFTSNYVGKVIKITNSDNQANLGFYTVTSVVNGDLRATKTQDLVNDGVVFTDFANDTGVSFEVINPTTGLALTGGSANDGAVSMDSLATAVLGSSSIDFDALEAANGGDLTVFKLQINGSDTDTGLYDIIDNSAGFLTITKRVVNESNLEYNIVDTSEQSSYVILNKGVAVGNDGKQLRVTLVDVKDADFFDPGWINAISSLELVDVDIVVPLPRQTMSVIAQNTLNHCLTMSNIINKRERVMFFGGISGLTPNNVLGKSLAAVEDIGVLEGIQGDSVTEVLQGNIEDLANYSVADAFGHTYRSTYFYPDEIVVNAEGSNIAVNGMYLAAAAAGFLAADVRLENPLTNKVLSGFTILRSRRYSQQTLRELAAGGITVLQPVTGGGRVIWGRTTSQSGFVEEQEISVVFIRDRVAKILRAAFSGAIGRAETDITRADLSVIAVGILNSLVKQNLITAYDSLSIKRDDVDPTQWNIGVRVQPNYPINFIYIKVNVGRL